MDGNPDWYSAFHKLCLDLQTNVSILYLYIDHWLTPRKKMNKPARYALCKMWLVASYQTTKVCNFCDGKFSNVTSHITIPYFYIHQA